MLIAYLVRRKYEDDEKKKPKPFDFTGFTYGAAFIDAEEEQQGRERAIARGSNLVAALEGRIAHAFKRTTRAEDEKVTPEQLRRKHLTWRLVNLVAGACAVALFMLTQNMSLPMVFVDSWTIIHVIIIVAQIVFILLANRSGKSPSARNRGSQGSGGGPVNWGTPIGGGAAAIVATDWQDTVVNVINAALSGIVIAVKRVREIATNIAESVSIGVERLIDRA